MTCYKCGAPVSGGLDTYGAFGAEICFTCWLNEESEARQLKEEWELMKAAGMVGNCGGCAFENCGCVAFGFVPWKVKEEPSQEVMT